MSYLKLMTSKGAIYLPDGKTKSRDVVCREGTLVDVRTTVATVLLYTILPSLQN